MVTVIIGGQPFQCSLRGKAKRTCKLLYIIAHLRNQLFFGNATHSGIRFVHANVGNIVEFAEYAELGELRNAGDEHKAQHLLTVFQRTVEIPHYVAQR